MRSTEAVPDEALRELLSLEASMHGLTAVLTGTAASLVVLEAWLVWRGAGDNSGLLQAVLLALVVFLSKAAWLWMNARRRVAQWARAFDARLGQGSGRALLGLGRSQEGAFAFSHADVRPARTTEKQLWLEHGKAVAWCPPLLLGLASILPLGQGLGLRVSCLFLALFLGWSAWRLGPCLEKG